ncbi:MAG: DUF3604 domain-containing protein [Kiritimatiellae bacterium]|nr:DUF3604 domain-containing protein [Kiritimatiellia bacterium]
MRRDQYGTDNGSVSLRIPNPRITVAQRYFVSVTYTAGPRGVAVGGSLRFRLPGGQASCSNPDVRLVCSDTLVPGSEKGKEFFTIRYLFVTVQDALLREGDTVTVSCGRHIDGLVAPLCAKRWPVEVATDLDGTCGGPGSGFVLVPDPPVLEFVSDKPAKLELTIASSTVVGAPFDAVVRARDKYHNIVSDYAGTVRLLAGPGVASAVLATHAFQPQDEGVHEFAVSLSEAGIHRLSVMDDAFGLYARSNPTRTTPDAPVRALFWGDTHTHSRISADTAAGNNLVADPAGDYDYARNRSDLDFCMVTDHSQDLCDADWQETCAAAAKWYEPGRFVTFSGYEATHRPLRKDGDKNVYFLRDDESYVNRGDTRETYAALKKSKGKVMVIPHQHANTNWACHDPELEPVVEVYAHWGCGLSPESEPQIIPGRGLPKACYVSHALEQGVKLGFIASADHSGGHPGDDFWWPLSSFNGGLAAVYAPALTREGIWDGLWARSCYGTTRARILLEFEIDGHVMGEAFADEAAARHIAANAYGTTAIEKVDLIKNGRLFHSHTGTPALDVELALTDDRPERETDYYYVHVVQVDGEQAWSSPIWITRG